MSRIARLGLLGAVAVAALLANAASAGAQLFKSDASQDGDEVLGSAIYIGSGGRRGSASICNWSVAFPDSGGAGTGFSGFDMGKLINRDVTATRYEVRCPDGSVSYRWVPDVTAQDLLGPLEDYVRKRLPAPEPVLQPFDDEHGWVYVQTPIDFRTGAATWEPVVATASVDGPPGASPWVTITATPTELLFSSGDPLDEGAVARCAGVGAVAAYVPDAPGACSYTYRNASTIVDGWLFPAQMAIRWDVTYDSSEGSGVLDMDPTITQIPLRVAEIKALVTCTGPMPEQGGC